MYQRHNVLINIVRGQTNKELYDIWYKECFIGSLQKIHVGFPNGYMYTTGP